MKADKTQHGAGRGSNWNKDFDLKKAPKIWQAAQGSGHRREKPSDEPDPEGVARRQSSPYTGKLSARPAGKPGDFFLVLGEFATIPSSPLLSATTSNILRRPVCVFQAWRNLSGPMWFQNQNQTPGWDRAASRWSAPSPGKRTRREDHAPSHRPQTSSGRLFLDRVARSRARLCFTGTRRLTRTPQRPRQKTTFLLCQEGDISILP